VRCEPKGDGSHFQGYKIIWVGGLSFTSVVKASPDPEAVPVLLVEWMWVGSLHPAPDAATGAWSSAVEVLGVDLKVFLTSLARDRDGAAIQGFRRLRQDVSWPQYRRLQEAAPFQQWRCSRSDDRGSSCLQWLYDSGDGSM
jgi:hypothetical protein